VTRNRQFLPKNAREAVADPRFLIGPYDPHCGEYTFLAPPLGVWRLADRSFAQDIPCNADNVEIRKAIIAMAHDLNIEVAAEGVETPRQWNFWSGTGAIGPKAISSIMRCRRRTSNAGCISAATFLRSTISRSGWPAMPHRKSPGGACDA